MEKSIVQLAWMNDFVALAETRSFARAAAIRNITSPAFGRRIRALETWAGCELIDRDGHPLVLTDAGEMFLLVARGVLRDTHEYRESVAERDRAARRGIIRIATGRTIATTRLPQWIAQMRPAMPDIDVRVSTGSVHDAAVAFLKGDADFLVTYFHARLLLRVNPALTESCKLSDELLMPVCAVEGGVPAFRLPGSRARAVPHIRFRPTLALSRIESEARRVSPRALHLDSLVEVDSPEAALGLCIAGIGVAWLPQSLAQAALDRGQLAFASPPESHFPFEIRAYRLNRAGSAVSDRCWQVLLALGKDGCCKHDPRSDSLDRT